MTGGVISRTAVYCVIIVFFGMSRVVIQHQDSYSTSSYIAIYKLGDH